MKGNNLQYIIMGILVLILAFATFLPKNNVQLINADEFNELVNSKDVFVINAHTPYTGEIEGTDLIAENWEDISSYNLPEDKNALIAVYCRSGRMSAITAEQLSDLGYKNIYDLDGGMNAWQQSGKQIIFK